MTSILLPDFNYSTTATCWKLLHYSWHKIHSKTEAFLIQFLWNFYSISYHKSRACTPIFMPIQKVLITQTWQRSQLAQILQYRTDFNHLSYTSSNVNQTWNQLVWILSQDINPFNPLTKCHLINLSNTNQSKLDY